MAPEQLAGEAVSVQSDIYSLGLVLYEVFGGQPLFRSGSLAELLKLKIQTEPPPLPLQLRVPAEIERAIMRCLAPDPQARPASASSVAVPIGGRCALGSRRGRRNARSRAGRTLWGQARICDSLPPSPAS